MGKTTIRVFTHDDLDGFGVGFLANTAFKEKVNVVYCTTANIDKKVTDFLGNKKYEHQDLFILDLSVNDKNEKNLEKRYQTGRFVQLIDHHKTAIHFNQHEWGLVQMESETGLKTSATSLFYSYLITKKLIEPTPFLTSFVELVRLYDTWSWFSSKQKTAKQLNDLFYLFGLSKFETEMSKKSKSQTTFSFSPSEQLVLDLEEKKIERYISKKQKQLTEIWYQDKYKIGVVHAEQYQSELGNELNLSNPHLDFIALINMGSRKMSLRSIHEEIDVSMIASGIGGGGHAAAAGCPLTEQNIQDFVLDSLAVRPRYQDAPSNFKNKKETAYETVYTNHSNEIHTISQVGTMWQTTDDKKFDTFDTAERHLKRNFDVWLAFDTIFFVYLAKKHGLNIDALRSQFDRTMSHLLSK